MLYTILMYIGAWLLTGFLTVLLIELFWFPYTESKPTSRQEAVIFTLLGGITLLIAVSGITYDLFFKGKAGWWDKPMLPTRSPRLVIQTGSGPFGKTVLSTLVCLPVAFYVWLCQIYSVDQAVSALIGTVLGQITGFVIFLIWWKE